MSARAFMQWQMYAELEPFDERRGDIRAAQIVATLANLHRNPDVRPEPYTIDEMQLRFGETKQQAKLTMDDLKRKLIQLAAAHGARIS